jgi:hypothetical protein
MGKKMSALVRGKYTLEFNQVDEQPENGNNHGFPIVNWLR